MKCKDCKFWKRDKYNYGECHKYTPDKWRRTNGEKNWCGEYQPKLPPVLELSLYSVDWSARTRKGLRKLGLSTFNDLIHKRRHELLGTRNFGVYSLYEVENKLKELGLALLEKD